MRLRWCQLYAMHIYKQSERHAAMHNAALGSLHTTTLLKRVFHIADLRVS